jgi:hypothetical protein
MSWWQITFDEALVVFALGEHPRGLELAQLARQEAGTAWSSRFDSVGHQLSDGEVQAFLPGILF